MKVKRKPIRPCGVVTFEPSEGMPCPHCGAYLNVLKMDASAFYCAGCVEAGVYSRTAWQEAYSELLKHGYAIEKTANGVTVTVYRHAVESAARQAQDDGFYTALERFAGAHCDSPSFALRSALNLVRNSARRVHITTVCTNELRYIFVHAMQGSRPSILTVAEFAAVATVIRDAFAGTPVRGVSAVKAVLS